MGDVLGLALALVAGGAIAAVYLGGLWVTVRQLPTARRPALLMVGSFAGRLALAAAGFALLLQGDPRRGVAAVVGFLVVRTVWVRAVRPVADPRVDAATVPAAPGEVEP